MDIPKIFIKNAHILCVLARAHDLKTLRQIIKDKKPNFFKILASICRNFLVGNLDVTKSQKQKLRAYTKSLRALYETRDAKKIKSILLREGGGLILIICRILEPFLLKAISQF